MKNKLLLGLATAISLFTATNRSSAQAPALGTTVNFELFTTVGAVSNTGISQITGNVGTNSGSSTNFGNVNGVMHDNDGASAQCAADLNIAYNQLNAAIPTFFPAPLLGNGQILHAGVYSISSPAVLNLGLTLDAQGNPNAVFIFQIQGALSTNASAKVHLVNGALACNVFWKVEGLISMAAGTSMKGTLIANNAAITTGSGDTIEGRALSTGGAITIDGLMGFTPIGCGSTLLTGPLPPNLVSAGCFGVFTSIGPVTNTATSFVSGDVGSNNGLTTGFNPLFVTGTIHSTPDGVTAACSSDLLNAYNYLNTLPADIELLFPVQFGNGLVLTPHTYVMNSACTFTDTLFLNAEGDANAVFVIQINGALTTSTFSVVKLVNGAQAKNVFWKVEGAVSINGSSIFCGTLVSNNGAINIAAADTIFGRMLSTNGAINTTSFVLKMPAGCSNAPNITVQPVSQVICSGPSASFSVVATGSALTYQWRNGNTNLVNGGNISGVTTATLTINPANITDTSSFYNVVVAGAYAPTDTSNFVSLTVNPVTSISSQPTNQAVCNGNTASFVVGAVGGSLTYQWRIGTVNLVNGGHITGANTATLTINPATGADSSQKYNVVIVGACAPSDTSLNVSLTINSVTSVNAVSNQTLCANTSTATVNFSGGVAGTTYSWSNSNTGIGLGLNGTGNLNSFVATNLLTTPITATITVTPTVGSCNGASTSFTITVNPTPVTAPVANQTLCNNTPTTLVTFTGGVAGTVFAWTNSNSLIGLAGNGTGAINSFNASDPGNSAIIATITISPSAGGCTGTNTSFTITVDPTPVVNPVGNQTFCDNASSVPVAFSSATAGTTYSWSNTNTAIGLAANGSGSIAAFTALNPGTTPVTATITVTPSAGACSGAGTSFTITVNPTPVMNAVANQTVCNNAATAPVVFSGGVAGTVFTWTNTNTSIGLAGNGSGNIASFNALNTGTAAVSGSITVAPSAGGCTGSSANFTITVDPSPVMTPVGNQTLCDSAATAAIAFASSVAGTTYSWSNNTPSIGLGNAGSGNIASFSAINTGSNAVVASISVTPSAGACTGSNQVFTITVNPTPLAVANSNTPVCVGSAIDLTAQTVTGDTYSWTGPSAFSSTLQNPVITNSVVTNGGTYILTVSGNGCSSKPVSITVAENSCVVTDLSVVKTVNNLFPIMGNNVVFTITVTNNGPGNATGVAVNDVLQSGYAFVSSTTTAGVFNPATGVWTIGAMNNGVSDVLTITATIVPNGNYINTAIVYGNELDPDMANNTSSVFTTPIDFFIPQGFSPNGDGVNDLFVIRGLELYPNNGFTVFNRWGDQVFSASPYLNNWDGTATSGVRVGGTVLPIGTYFYIFTLGDGSNTVLKGTIYLNK